MSGSITRPEIFERMAAVSDATRARLLLILERGELAVGELCAVLQLPQSTVSRHLKVLADGGWVAARRDGASHRYRLEGDGLDGRARRLWALTREEVALTPSAHQDALRLDSVLAERRSRSQAFFASAAGEWDRLRSELFGTHSDLSALLGLLDPGWVVGDLGCGTGRACAALAPFVQRVVGIDSSEPMLAAARSRLAPFPNVELRHGELETLPLGDGELDAAVLALVLHHVSEPPRVLAEVRRVLRPGGCALIVDMLPHDREELRQQMGHAWLGFEERQLARWLAEVGLGATRVVPLPPEPAARGPALFVATARCPAPAPPTREARRAAEAPSRSRSIDSLAPAVAGAGSDLATETP